MNQWFKRNHKIVKGHQMVYTSCCQVLKTCNKSQ